MRARPPVANGNLVQRTTIPDAKAGQTSQLCFYTKAAGDHGERRSRPSSSEARRTSQKTPNGHYMELANGRIAQATRVRLRTAQCSAERTSIDPKASQNLRGYSWAILVHNIFETGSTPLSWICGFLVKLQTPWRPQHRGGSMGSTQSQVTILVALRQRLPKAHISTS